MGPEFPLGRTVVRSAFGSVINSPLVRDEDAATAPFTDATKKHIRTKVGTDLYNFANHTTVVSTTIDSNTTWWRGNAAITNASHPHLGARLWTAGNHKPLVQMIVDPSPKRLSSRRYHGGGEDAKNFTTKDDKILCPRGSDGRPTWGIEGEGGHAALLKVRSGIQDYFAESAGEKKRKSKVLCMIYTVGLPGPRSNLKAIAETWAPRCDGFFAASNETDHSLGAIDLLHQGREEYQNMWQKVRSMWAYAYDHYRNEFDFFHIAGDDTYVAVDNLRSFLDGPDVIRLEEGHLDEISSHPQYRKEAERWINKGNASRPLIFGVPVPYRGSVFPAGGPGYTLNRAALEVLANSGFGLPQLRDLNDSREDVFMGETLAHNGVYVSHVLDQSKGWRFGESAEFSSNHFKGKPSFYGLKGLSAKFGLESGDYLDSISKEASAFHLKIDRKKQNIAKLIQRYHAILYDLCYHTDKLDETKDVVKTLA